MYLFLWSVTGQGATNEKQLHDQLRLAITWNRSDIAEEKIFTQNIMWPSGPCWLFSSNIMSFIEYVCFDQCQIILKLQSLADFFIKS